MDNVEESENDRNRKVRMECIDFAIRSIGKPVYLTDENNKMKKYQDDVIDLAEKIHEFVTKK
jgi:isocitrate dehydrogenase